MNPVRLRITPICRCLHYKCSYRERGFPLWHCIIKRLTFFIPAVFFILFVNFAVLEWVPGDPMQYKEDVLSEFCLDEDIALDKPRWQRVGIHKITFNIS